MEASSTTSPISDEAVVMTEPPVETSTTMMPKPMESAVETGLPLEEPDVPVMQEPDVPVMP